MEKKQKVKTFLSDQLGVIESRLLKTCRNRASVVLAFDEAVKTIGGISGVIFLFVSLCSSSSSFRIGS